MSIALLVYKLRFAFAAQHFLSCAPTLGYYDTRTLFQAGGDAVPCLHAGVSTYLALTRQQSLDGWHWCRYCRTLVFYFLLCDVFVCIVRPFIFRLMVLFLREIFTAFHTVANGKETLPILTLRYLKISVPLYSPFKPVLQ